MEGRILHQPDLPKLSVYARELEQARAAQQAGRFDAAEKICHDVLQQDAGNAAALHRLGVLAYARGRPGDAVALIRRALASQPNVPEFHVSLCLALLAAGEREQYQACLQSAERAIRALLETAPDDPDALHRLGVLADLRGEPRLACELIARAIALRAGDPEIHNNLGLALLADRRAEAAEQSFSTALRLNPDYIGAASNLALALEAQGKYADAITACRRVLGLKPDFALAWFNLGSLLHQHGDQGEAEAAFVRAIELKPDYAEAWNNLGSIYEKQSRTDQAIESFRKALALKPLDIQPRMSLGGLFNNLGRMDEAENVYREAQRTINDASLDIQLATMLPPIMPPAAGIAAARARYERELNALLQRPIRIGDLQAQGGSNFFLPYHGMDDRPLQELLARVYLKARPDLGWSGSAPARRGGKIKIGFVSSFFNNHTIGKLTGGLIAHLARDRFEITTLFAPPYKSDGMSQFIAAHSDAHHILPAELDAARQLIAGLELDILFYTDIGMDLYTYFLAYARLAPVQCVTWGHPVTTGIPNIDYYISHEDCELKGSQAQYSEKLICVRRPAMYTYFWRPQLPESGKTRADFGLPEDGHLYICPQSLFKLHPDFDPVLADILRRDPAGRLVLIDGGSLAWNGVLLKRFAASMADDVLKRVLFLPRQQGTDFISLIEVCDVMLDPLHFVGATSSFEGFAVGLPIVTLPSQFMRGRFTHAFYLRMEISECTASSPDEYADIAVRLGTDARYRAQVRSQILSRNHLLYEDLGAVREFERCFEAMHSGGG
ncbi:MAG: tetratricopeptide repeat protein [Rhodospirillales bacterium]